MAINPALLVSAAILQDYFSDNATDAAMSAGVITCYQDNSRTTLKNWYYQSGTPGAYTYIPLPNPLTLSAAGTIEDAMGNDTIPFWYPYSEIDNVTFQPYYVTVVNSNGQVQFTRQNFPYVAQQNVVSEVATLQNYIINNVFWRNIGSYNATTMTVDPLSGLLSKVLAPSQHDGFSMQDLQYIKNINGAVETITFSPFGPGNDPLIGDITPEYYINHNCTAVQPGEMFKYYQLPISYHIKTLENVSATVTIQAQNVAGSANNSITLSIYQFLGSGVVSPEPKVIMTLALSGAWTKYSIPFMFATSTGQTLSSTGDDAFYLQIGMPLSQVCNINFTKPSIYLSASVPTNDFQTYDDIDAFINSPRTGDIRTSLNDFYPFGWVPLNNGTIGNPNSNATCRANIDTWPLYNLIWNKFFNYNNSGFNLLAQLVRSDGIPIAYTISALTDWTANNAITLTQAMGRVLLGTVPSAAQIISYGTSFIADNGAGNMIIVTGNNVNYYNGMPVYIKTTGALPVGLFASIIYYVAAFNGTNGFYLATSFANAMAANQTVTGNVVAWGGTNGTGSTIYAALNNSQSGEYAHTQQLAELASHLHLIPVGSGTSTNTVGNNGANNTGSANTSLAGNSVPFNVTQPSVAVNMYMKL